MKKEILAFTMLLLFTAIGCDKTAKEFDHAILRSYTNKTNCVRIGSPSGHKVVECLWTVGYTRHYHSYLGIKDFQFEIDSKIEGFKIQAWEADTDEDVSQ